MRCYICDKSLSEEEIKISPDKVSFEPCMTCLEIALETAYSDGFVREDPLDDESMEELFGSGAVDTLDPDTHRSYYDHCDVNVDTHLNE